MRVVKREAPNKLLFDIGEQSVDGETNGKAADNGKAPANGKEATGV